MPTAAEALPREGVLDEVSDGELMAAVQAGDRLAFAGLVDRYKDPLVNYLTRLCGCRQRAEDIAQETFLALYERASRYDEQGKLRAFLYRIASNRLRSEERRDKRWRLLQPLLGSDNGHGGRSGPLPATSQRAEARELRSRLAEALAELPLRYRVPLVLYEVEGWPYADIAHQLGCREGTVKSRIHRGKQRLRERLDPYWNGGQR